MNTPPIEAPLPAGPAPGPIPRTPVAEWKPGGFARSILKRLHAFASESAWLPLAGKMAIATGAFLALALVGSGAAMDVLPKSAAKYLGPPTTTAPTSAGPPTDAGAPPIEPAPSHDGGSPVALHDAGPPHADAGAASPGGPAGQGMTTDGMVILNLATEEDLRKLPGIGPSKAKAILALRQKLGRFRRVEDLLRVKGIGRKSLARLRPRLLVDPPP